MTSAAETSIQQGDLEGALVQLQESVRDDPGNASLRIFLFQLLAVTGNWKRALTQLNVAADMDGTALLMGQTYRELLHCENYRTSVFAGERAPLMMGEPPAWMAKLIQALPLSASGDGAGARALVDAAFEQAETRKGTIDGVPFEWVSDSDMRLGPVLEAIINGKYYWIPLDNIAKLTISAPDDLRDLVWIPVEFTWTNGGESIGFLPSRYAGEKTLSDPQTALARKTEWQDLGGDFYIGAGQKTLSTDVDEYPLLQVNNIVFETSDKAD